MKYPPRLKHCPHCGAFLADDAYYARQYCNRIGCDYVGPSPKPDDPPGPEWTPGRGLGAALCDDGDKTR